MDIKLTEINRDDLKVGDTVGIAREIRCGWGTGFRHSCIYPAKIVKIRDTIYKIDQFGNVPGLRHLREEDILEMTDYAEKIMEILDRYRKE